MSHDFYDDCFEVLYDKNIPGIRLVFHKYFPQPAYKFADLSTELQNSVIHVSEDACELHITEIIDLMIETFGTLVPPTGTWTNHCCSVGAISIIRRIRELGYELDAINDKTNLLASFPLRTAIISRNIDTVQYLLDLDADPTLREPELREGLLECAYYCDALEIARLLTTPKTIKMRLKDYPVYEMYPYGGNILDLARFEKKAKFVELFEGILQNEPVDQ